MEIERKQLSALRLAAVPHRGPYPGISAAFSRLGGIAGPAGLLGSAQGMVAVFYDDPATTPAAELRSDAAIVVPAGVKLPDGLEEHWIPEGWYACTTHVGPYDRLGEVWGRLRSDWAAGGGAAAKRASLEWYHNTPGTVPPEQLRTELFLPIPGPTDS